MKMIWNKKGFGKHLLGFQRYSDNDWLLINESTDVTVRNSWHSNIQRTLKFWDRQVGWNVKDIMSPEKHQKQNETKKWDILERPVYKRLFF